MNNWRKLERRILNKKDLLKERTFAFSIGATGWKAKPVTLRLSRGHSPHDAKGRYVVLDIFSKHEDGFCVSCDVDIDALYMLAWTARDAMPERDDE